MHYLDHAATTPLRPEVWEAMEPFARERFGNSSGAHEVSRSAKNALEEARELVAETLGCSPHEIVFTGGGTESDNLAVKGAAFAAAGRNGVVTTAVEHEAVREAAAFLRRRGHPVSIAGVDGYGRVDPDEVASLVDRRTAVVSVMAVNNETGTIQPLSDVIAAVRAADPDVVVHTDAIQAFPSDSIDVADLGVDLLSLTAHKFGGPKGVGVLYVRDGVRLEPLLHGGGQELGRRSGTHDVMGAVGLATAMRLTEAQRIEFAGRVSQERKDLEHGLGDRAVRTVPAHLSTRHHAHLRIEGTRNDALLVRLDRRGLAVSAASACQSGATTVSHVLTAMGFGAEQARECLRFSFGWSTRPGDGARAAQLVIDALGDAA